MDGLIEVPGSKFFHFEPGGLHTPPLKKTFFKGKNALQLEQQDTSRPVRYVS